MFSVRADPRLYNEDPRAAELELRESLETAIGDNGEEMSRKELGCARKTSRVL
jgi:hypothetical protein